MNFAPSASLRSSLVCFSLLTSGVIGLAGCNSDPTPITSQTSKYEVAEGEGGTSAATPANDTSSSSSPRSTAPGSVDAGSFEPGEPAAHPANTAASSNPSSAADIVGAQNNSDAGPNKPSATPPSEVTGPPKSNDPKELLAYMHELMSRQPRGTTNAEKIARFQETQQEVIQVADRILSSQADDDTALAAAEAKIQVWSKLLQLGHPDAKQELQTFIGGLTKSKNPKIVQLGRKMSFAQLMATYDPTNEGQTKKLLSEFHSLFKTEKKDESLFGLGTEVARLFMQSGKNPEAIEVMKATHDAFADQKDSPLAAQVRSLAEEIKFVELDINVKVREYVDDAPNSEKALLDTLDKLFADKDVGPTTLQIAMQLVPMIEMRSLDAAAHVYEQMEKAFGQSSNAEIAEVVKASIDKFGKRRGLIGKPFVVEGVTLQGTKFDWSKFKGKVVLVDFWATWCQPCLKEIPNIRQNYDQYHDQGFEVVGVNIDDDVEQVQRFFSQQELAWPTVRTADPNKNGFDHPLLTQSGAEGIPFLVLIGEGNVIALNPRGEELGKKLAELFASNTAPAKESSTPAKEDSTPPKSGTKNKTSGMQPTHRARVTSSFVGTDVTAQLSTVFSTAASVEPNATDSNEPSCGEENKEEAKEPNPYLASPGLSTKELVDYVLELQDKPRSIQVREGFAAAVSDAADRILAGQASEKEQLIAIQAKFGILRQAADNGDEKAAKQLIEFADKMKGDKRESVAVEVQLVQTEKKASAIAELAAEKIDSALDELKKYFQETTLTQRHLQLASSTVEAINKIKDKELREKRFKEFGDLFAKSEDKTLARYGARIAEPAPVEASDWIGKPLQLAGTTTQGTPLDWASYRKKIVVVDIWATWCGPCREQMPRLVALHEKLASQGFDVVGVSVDKDASALEDFLGKNEVPWTTISGQEAFDFAKGLGVRGIPTMLLVDRDGKVLATAHSVDELAPQIEKLLEKPKAG